MKITTIYKETRKYLITSYWSNQWNAIVRIKQNTVIFEFSADLIDVVLHAFKIRSVEIVWTAWRQPRIQLFVFEANICEVNCLIVCEWQERQGLKQQSDQK